MMRKIGKYMRLLCLALALAASVPGYAAVPAWELVEARQASDEAAERIEAYAREGYIYVVCPRPVTVKVMSILGQQITQAKLPAGVSRIKIASRGIYILQAGDTTIRIAI